MLPRLFTVLSLLLLPAGCAPAPASQTMPQSAAALRPGVGEGYGTDAVVAFYEALLQEKSPTVEQERAIFTRTSAVRTRLALGERPWVDDEPMTRTPERRRELELEKQKVEAAGPVVLEYLRKHRDWFLPTNGIGSKRDVALSSFMRIVRSLEEPKKSPPGWGYVIALFPNERGARPARTRSVVFATRDDGKIDPDAISLDGFGGETVFDKVMAGAAKDRYPRPSSPAASQRPGGNIPAAAPPPVHTTPAPTELWSWPSWSGVVRAWWHLVPRPLSTGSRTLYTSCLPPPRPTQRHFPRLGTRCRSSSH